MSKIFRGTLLVTLVLALGACGWFAPAEASDSTLLAQPPALGLTIQVQNATDIFNTVGQIIRYNYVVNYTGTAALAGPVIVADAQSPVACPEVNTVGNLNGSLDQNETIICTSTYAITQADLTAGSVTKNATATVGGVNSNQATLSTAVVQTRTLTLTKSANPVSYNQLGAVITYTYAIKNSGSTPIGPTQFTVTDNRISAPINCGANTVTLLPNETVTCTATYTISQADISAALVTNNASAAGGGASSQAVSATINNSGVVQPNPNPSNLPAGTTIQHRVVAGEWLIQIARCYGANYTDVSNANPHITDPDIISIDTIVSVPRIGSVGKIYGPPCVTTHTVQSGETWASIAQRYNADVVVLQAANPGSLLTAGSVLKIPLNSFSGVITTPAPPLAATLTATLSTIITPTATLTPNPTDPIRITFPQGTTSATINGTLNAQSGVRYVIGGAQGQVMTVTITSTPVNEIAWAVYDPAGVAVRPLDANSSWTGTLPANGDYRIDLSGIGSSNKTYSLTVSITTPLSADAPSDITP